MSEAQTIEFAERKVSILLIVGIVLIPIVFAWFLLRKGYSSTAKLIGFGWLILSVLLVLSAGEEPVDSSELASTNSSTQQTVKEEPVLQEESAKPDSFKEFEAALFQELGSLKSKWDSVEVNEASGRTYRLAVNYIESASISGYTEVSNDTKAIARAALKVLMSQGRKPKEEWISVSVWARQPAGFGETGTPLTRMLGNARYDFNSDQLVFNEPGK